ncbi:hypothetical protein C4573_02400 [Candidatus Woesearchaeota archaeon]|nr:MAG: hypothetical protein C4573_02400 [Candidatus Woesearchaeota archaeon]
MAEPAKTVFILYANTDHSDVPRATQLRSIQRGNDYDTMIGAVKEAQTPVVLSAQGLDFDIWNLVNPSFVRAIANDPLFSFTAGMYSHALPSMHPENLDRQLNYGLESMVKAGIKPAPIVMLPEFDFAHGQIALLHSARCDCVLLQAGVNSSYEHREDYGSKVKSKHPLGMVQDALGNRIAGIVTQGDELRKTYLAMLRGFATPYDMVQALAKESEYAGKTLDGKQPSPVMPFLVDLEAVQLNDAMPIFEAFIAELGKHKEELRLSGFDRKTSSAIVAFFQKRILNYPVLDVAVRPKQKWRFDKDPHSVADRLKTLDLEARSPYHRRAAVWASISDLYSAQAAYAKDPEHGVAVRLDKLVEGKVLPKAVAIGGDRNRIAEVLNVVDAVERQVNITETMADLSPESRAYMCLLDVVFKNS